MTVSSAPVRIRRTELNLSLPDSQSAGQRLSRRFEQMLRHSLSRIPDRLLPQVEEMLHLGTLNLDLGTFDIDLGNLNHWQRLEGLFQERLRQQLLALLKQASVVVRPEAEEDRSTVLPGNQEPVAELSEPTVTTEIEATTTVKALANAAGGTDVVLNHPSGIGASARDGLSSSEQQAAVAAVMAPVQRLLTVLQDTSGQVAAAADRQTRSASRINSRQLSALCRELHRSTQLPALPEPLHRALTELVSDLELWLAPASSQLIAQLAQLLAPLQQATQLSQVRPVTTDEQQILTVLDRPFLSAEAQADQTGKLQVSCTALEAALGALIARRQLAPAPAATLGLWLSRQTTLSPPLRRRRLQALHRYLRRRRNHTGLLADRSHKAEGTETDNQRRSRPAKKLASTVEPTLHGDGGAEFITDSDSHVNPSASRGGQPISGVQEDHSPRTGTTASTRSVPATPGASGTHSRHESHDDTTSDGHPVATFTTPAMPSMTRIIWMVEALLADPTLPCQLAQDLSVWRQRFETLPPMSRYRWLKALTQRLQQLPGSQQQDNHPHPQASVVTPKDWDYHRLYQQFVTSWASAPVHSLALEWTTSVQQSSAGLVQADQRLALSQAVQRLFVVISVAAERATDMAGWLRRYRKRWQQWLKQLDPNAPKLSFSQRERLWPDQQPVLPGWSNGALIVALDQQIQQYQHRLQQCRRSQPPLATLLRGCLAVNIDQPVDLASACRDWLDTRPPASVPLQQAMADLLNRPERLTPDAIRDLVKQADQALTTEIRQQTEQLRQLRQLTADLFCSTPDADLDNRLRSVSLPEPPAVTEPGDKVMPLPKSLTEQSQKLLKALKQTLRPAIPMHPLEHDLLVSGAGLVLFWPHLERLFAPLLNDQQQWLSPEHQWQGLAQLLALAGLPEPNDGLSPVAALLTGLPTDTPVMDLPALTAQQRHTSAMLLTTVVQQWPALKGMSPHSLQQLFVQRTGYLDQTAHGWRLTLEHKPQDILLQALPWPVSVVRLPWTDSLLGVEWDTGPAGLWRPFQ